MAKEKKIKSEIDLVEKVTKQIITLAAGTVVVLVTILGYYLEYFQAKPVSWIWIVLIACAFLLISIIFGLAVYGSLISSIDDKEKLEDVDVYSCTIRSIAVIQWVTFIIGIFFIIVSLYLISLS